MRNDRRFFLWRFLESIFSGGVKVFSPRVKVFWVPIQRLKAEAVFSGAVISCSRATAPTVSFPSLSRLTTLGVRN